MPPRLKMTVERRRLQLNLPTDVSDTLDAIAIAQKRNVTAVLTDLITREGQRLKLGAFAPAEKVVGPTAYERNRAAKRAAAPGCWMGGESYTMRDGQVVVYHGTLDGKVGWGYYPGVPLRAGDPRRRAIPMAVVSEFMAENPPPPHARQIETVLIPEFDALCPKHDADRDRYERVRRLQAGEHYQKEFEARQRAYAWREANTAVEAPGSRAGRIQVGVDPETNEPIYGELVEPVTPAIAVGIEKAQAELDRALEELEAGD